MTRAITIGDIALHDFEVPSSVRFGGRQRLVTHRTSDGTRTVELLGPDDAEVHFAGVLSGTNAESRARELNALRLTGTTVWLTWGSFRYQVLVERFSAIYHSRWWISYGISCVLVHQPGTMPLELVNLAAFLSGAASSAATALVGTDIDASTLSVAMAADGALVSGTAANTEALTTATGVLTAVQSEIDLQSEVLVDLSQDQETSSQAAASSFASQVACAGSLACAANARSYVGIICGRLGSAGG